MELHPQLIEKDGKKEFVVLPYVEYLALMELIDDYEDLRELREAIKASRGEKGVPLEKVLSELERE